jgi:two-component system, NtrC family, nitrogen regulation sensor histidine kinase NtrY
MKDRTIRNVRPALWGFFICIALAGVLYVIRIFIPAYITYRWDTERSFRRSQNEQIIRNAFQSRVEQLTKILENVSSDTSLSASINMNGVPVALRAFHALNIYRLHEDQTLDLVDPQGNPFAWNGPSITHRYTEVIGQNPPKQFVRVTQNGLRTYLTVGRCLTSDKYYLMVSEPLELNSPISNRFVQKVSLSEDLSQKLKVKVTLRIPHTVQPFQGEFVIPIINKEGNTIVEFSVEEKTIESEIASVIEVYSMLIGICLAFGSIFLAYAGTMWISKIRKDWTPTVVSILLLWLVRLVLREVEFPANVINGWLFNPNLYASPFIFGLSSSLGELILSTGTVAISVWLLFMHMIFNKNAEETIARLGSRVKRIGTLVIFFVIALLSLWIFRGFNEAIRSFVFDSTIQFNNPSEILLDSTSAIMYLNVILLGISLLCVSTSLFWIGRKILSIQFPSSELKIRIFYIALLLLCIPLFAWIDETPQSQFFSTILFIMLSIVLVELLSRWEYLKTGLPSMKWRTVVSLVLGSFLLGVPMIHQKLQQRECKEVEVVAKELLRPSDNWLTYVVLDGIRTSVEGIKNELMTHDIAEAKRTNLAFVLWTKTLLGKEGFNSALVLYDQKGDEVDRFVVGMNKLEQQEILTQVFEGEENAVHFIGRTGQKTLGKLYGAWITVRDSNEKFVGSLALLLSEHQRTFFHDQETEPLRQFGNRFENNIVREIAFHEYKIDTLIFSTGNKLIPDKFLSPIIMADLQITPSAILWEEIKINGYETQTVFLKDMDSPEKVVSVSLERLDVRWELFSYLKEFFLCLSVLAVTGIYASIRKRDHSVLPTLGFKGKLFLGFACITLLPLAVLSYYNKQLVAERVQEQVEATLFRELSQLQDRISTYITDEEDFVFGVDDDFCEALASEYSIDFSVYRNASIQASSLSELYRAGLLDGRLNGEAFSSSVLGRKSYFLTKEKIGTVEYVVGYAPISIAGSIVGVLTIPTLNREKEIESELAKRNAYVFGAYAIVFGIALVGGGLLALRFAQPLRQLTLAAKDVSEGNLAVRVETHSRDEIGILARSFNEMVLKLQKSREELSKHERESAWKEMAKQVAHEIRNPLTPIKLSIQHVRQAFKDKAPDREEILQRVTQTVIDQIEVLSRIASEFSSFAKMPESKFERLNIDELLKEIINLFREVQGISFVYTPSSSMAMIVADRDQLRGVFINIIRNAIQAIQESGTITAVTSLEKHICIIRISDTGPGIPEEIRTRIFEPNFSTKTEGMGLGLAIARRVIEDHGGTISCSSERGKGTTFEIRLPA